MKKILVPCDFSKPSMEAFTFAVEIAKKSGGTVILLHIVEVPVMHDTTIMPVLYLEAAYFKDLKTNAEKKFDKMKSRLAKTDIKIQSVIEMGPIHQTILHFVKAKNIDLIIMGTHGTSGLLESIVGSNTEKMVRFATVPVITIYQSARVSRIKNIVLPTALHQNQNHGLLIRQVKKLQTLLAAKLHLLVVNTPSNLMRSSDENELIEAYAKHYKLENYTINTINDFTVGDGIIHFAHKIKADMIAMGTHGRKGLAHLFLSSIAAQVSTQIEYPIWTYVEKS